MDLSLSVVIPTYGRDQVLTDTLELILDLATKPELILVVDQSVSHGPDAESLLKGWNAEGKIQWVKRSQPSITEAMNAGLRMATSSLVLFLDDDIEPIADLAAQHAAAHREDPALWATVGQVIQPWQQAEAIEAPRKLTGLKKDTDFPYHSTIDADLEDVMAGNLCVNRERALSIGGFDENFTGSAYRFETEFVRRVVAAGGKIRFLGSAGIRHLRAQEGGTRSEGSHLTSSSPKHGFSDYYYSYLHAGRGEGLRYRLSRLRGEVLTRFHLTHPWWIPAKLLGELRAWRRAREKTEKLKN